MAKCQASLLEISRGAVYYQQRPTSEADLSLMRRIDELHLEHPFMGARIMRRQLQRQSIHVGRRHLSTLMERMGIQALCPQPGTSKRHPQHKIYPYLLRKVAIRRANQVWSLDTTYITMARPTLVCKMFHRLHDPSILDKMPALLDSGNKRGRRKLTNGHW